MKAKEKLVLAMLGRVQEFLAEFPPPATAGFTAQKAVLDDVVTRLTEHTTDQLSGRRLSKGEVDKQKALRKELRDVHLGPIAQIARALLSAAPGIDKALKRPNDNLATLKYVAEALAIRDAVRTYAPSFVQAGRPEDFLEQLEQCAEALRQSVLGKGRRIGQTAGATMGLTDEIKRGRKVVLVLDTIVRSAFAHNGDVLGRWRSVKRIGQVVGGGVRATGGTADENVPEEAVRAVPVAPATTSTTPAAA